MFVVSFWNDRHTVLLRKNDRIVGFDRKSLELCLGCGEPIELEVGDTIQNKFDEEFQPKVFIVPDWVEKKFLSPRPRRNYN